MNHYWYDFLETLNEWIINKFTRHTRSPLLGFNLTREKGRCTSWWAGWLVMKKSQHLLPKYHGTSFLRDGIGFLGTPPVRILFQEESNFPLWDGANGGNTYWLDAILDFTHGNFSFHFISIVEGQHPAPVDLIDFLLITVSRKPFLCVVGLVRQECGTMIPCHVPALMGWDHQGPFLSVWLDNCWYFNRLGTSKVFEI